MKCYPANLYVAHEYRTEWFGTQREAKDAVERWVVANPDEDRSHSGVGKPLTIRLTRKNLLRLLNVLLDGAPDE